MRLMGVIHKSILNSIYIEGIVILFELNSPILLITNLLTCCITFFDGMTFDILKNKIAESDEQDKKKGVNWQSSVDNEVQAQALPETEPICCNVLKVEFKFNNSCIIGLCLLLFYLCNYVCNFTNLCSFQYLFFQVIYFMCYKTW